jgi:hypothetical protein
MGHMLAAVCPWHRCVGSLRICVCVSAHGFGTRLNRVPCWNNSRRQWVNCNSAKCGRISNNCNNALLPGNHVCGEIATRYIRDQFVDKIGERLGEPQR